MITHKSLSFISTNYSRIIYPLIKMISKDDRLDGSRKESRLRKKKKEKPRTSLNLEARAKDESRNYSRS